MKNHKPKQTKLPLSEFQKAWETKGVFSEHYIKSRLNKSSVWPKEEEVKPVWDFCHNLWGKKFLKLVNANEDVTRQEFLNKILEKLGFSYLPNTFLPISEKGKEPDYILFADESSKDSVLGKSKMEQYKKAISLLEAKKVHHSLSKVSERETPGRFPHQQVRDYLQEAADESGKAFFNWAVLTNGGKWRLYCRDAHPSAYFEFNLEDSINSFKDFMLFFVLFRRDAFTPDSEGLCPLDYLRKEALQYQAELEVDLRKRVFNILVSLANGFYQRPENKIENLDELYENCLIFLYRLLFVLYAEGRGLLPVRPHGAGSNKHYIERYSLQRLIPRLKNRPDYFSEELTNLYEELLGLFHLINGDNLPRNKACNVPRYNGGLFNPKEYPRIDEWRVGEKTLADVLTGLMFTPVPAGRGEQRKFHFGETIDYADLEVRQLGSIYEGLLENHLEPEDNRLVLRGDKTERKETGTYYTPDYIVRYIVENTVKPLCDRINETSKVKNAIEKGIKDNSFTREVLKLKILDPAMGSGHFLVRATELLADEIVNHPTTLVQTESVSPKNPREEIVSMDKMPVSKGLSQEEAEISYWRRRVVESCIYGVDLNPLAVELAKLSLWLTCIATDQPLSFLDHHLRPGNSLIGAKLAELGTHPRKKATKVAPIPFGPDLPEAVSEAISTLKEITETESKDVSTIKDKEARWHKKVWERLKPYRTIADLWTSTFFGNKIDGPTYQSLAKLLIQNPAPRTKEARKLQEKIESFTSSLDKARRRYFFHWELEFPEVFFNEDGTPKKNAGFDAVIGNPPYNAELDRFESSWMNEKINYSKNGRLDTASLFVERFTSMLKSNKVLTYLLPHRLISRQRDFGPFQKYIFENGFLKEITYLGIVPEFESKDEFMISSFEKDYYGDFIVSYNIPRQEFPDIMKDKQSIKRKLWGPPNYTFNIYLNEFSQSVLEKVVNISFPLSKIAESKDGIVVFLREKLLSDNQIDTRYKKLLGISGRYSLDRYSFSWTPTYICYDIKEAKKYISDPNELRKVQLRNASIFEKKEKIITAQDSIALKGTIDSEQFFHTNSIQTTYLIKNTPYSLKYLLCLVNHPLLSYFYQTLNLKGKDLHPQILVTNIPRLPIRHISFTTLKSERVRLVEELRTMFDTGNYEDTLGAVEECLPKDRKGNFITKKEKSDVVHDFLAFLAEKMIEMNKEKQNLIRQFLEWLESEVTKGSVDSLKSKSKIKEFYNYDFDAFIGVLKQNRILPKVIEFGNEQYKKLKEAYDTTTTKLHPLISKINDTDNLIDQIVYKLYGLTKEEIRIVEKER